MAWLPKLRFRYIAFNLRILPGLLSYLKFIDTTRWQNKSVHSKQKSCCRVCRPSSRAPPTHFTTTSSFFVPLSPSSKRDWGEKQIVSELLETGSFIRSCLLDYNLLKRYHSKKFNIIRSFMRNYRKFKIIVGSKFKNKFRVLKLYFAFFLYMPSDCLRILSIKRPLQSTNRPSIPNSLLFKVPQQIINPNQRHKSHTTQPHLSLQ